MRLPGAPGESAEILLRKWQRDLHDDVGAALAAVATQLELALQLIEQDRRKAASLIERSRGETVAMIGKVRELVVDPYAGSLLVRDRPDVVAWLSDALFELSVAFEAPAELTIDIDPGLASLPESTLDDIYRIVHEAVVNVLRHAGATRCWVEISVGEAEVQLRVRDNGVGFPLGRVPEGTGLTSMQERAENHGGSCTVRPATPSGVVVEAAIPFSR
ncbi:ATP-binding protein [Actinoplanes sp. NPDC051411]|uniref:sensor histidine kinase n=1 Tax=Actinoplanes sp. NPDC051411 TaxID=3155522 RepID=UPI0034311418